MFKNKCNKYHDYFVKVNTFAIILDLHDKCWPNVTHALINYRRLVYISCFRSRIMTIISAFENVKCKLIQRKSGYIYTSADTCMVVKLELMGLILLSLMLAK